MVFIKRKAILISAISVIVCGLYTALLFSNYNNYLYTSIFKLIIFLIIPIIYYKYIKKESITQLIKFDKKNKYIKIPSFLAIGSFVIIILGFIILYDFFDKQMIINGLLNQGIVRQSYPYVFIHIVLINAFLEELFFRGFIFLELYKMGYKIYAYLFSSVLFAIYHIAMMGSWFSFGIFILCMIGLVIAGVLFNELDRRCDNILGGLLVHLGANLGINLIGAYLFYL